MEKLIFYNYLNYQKENQNITIKKILKLPIVALVLLGLALVCVVFGILCLFFSTIRAFTWFFIILALACDIGLTIYIEHYQIKYSDVNIERYRDYCSSLFIWLKKFDISTKKKTIEIHTRILLCIKESEEQSNREKERFDKWLQVLIIPIVLAIFSVFIKEQKNIETVIMYTLNLLIIFVSIYILIDLGRRGKYFFKNRHLEQMQSFADDLQGIIDTQFDSKSNTKLNPHVKVHRKVRN